MDNRRSGLVTLRLCVVIEELDILIGEAHTDLHTMSIPEVVAIGYRLSVHERDRGLGAAVGPSGVGPQVGEGEITGVISHRANLETSGGRRMLILGAAESPPC